MKLSENLKNVQTLKRFLKETDYLEYDEDRSKGDVLSVQVTAFDTERDFDNWVIYAKNWKNLLIFVFLFLTVPILKGMTMERQRTISP